MTSGSILIYKTRMTSMNYGRKVIQVITETFLAGVEEMTPQNRC